MKMFILSVIASSLLTTAAFAQSNGPGNNFAGGNYLPLYECVASQGFNVSLLVSGEALCLQEKGPSKGLIVINEGFGPSATEVQVSFEDKKTVAENKVIKLSIDKKTLNAKVEGQTPDLELTCDPVYPRIDCI